MALSLDCVPQAVSLSVNVSIADGLATQIVQKFVPKTASGAVYDCTSATSVTITLLPQGNQAGFSYTGASVTLSSHDATGAAILITAANVYSILNTLAGPKNLQYAVVLSDGTNTVQIGIGNMNITYNP